MPTIRDSRFQQPIAEDGIAAPSLRHLLADWRAAPAGANGIPAESFIDPFRLRYLIENLIVVEIVARPDGVGRRYRYRLIGTRPTRLRGREVTGLTVEEGYFGASLAAALENYRLVIEEKKPVYDWDHTPAESGFAREAETLLLPLSSDGRSVDMVLVYQEVDQWVWARDDPDAP